jgi:mannose-1-phosphate guanylyltransferase
LAIVAPAHTVPYETEAFFLQAVILVGGEGTRLRPLTYGTPKPMVPIFGVPFLERTLARLAGAGVRHAILAAGYLPDQIAAHLGDGSRLGLSIDYVVESSPLGTAGALRNVADLISGPFFVLNGDVLTSLDLRAMAEAHRRTGGAATLHVIRVEDPSAFGCVVHASDGRVSAFVEKPPRESAPTNEVNAGTYLLERHVLDLIPAGRSVSIERETFPRLIHSGAGLFAHTTADYWIDIGRPEHYLRAHHDVLKGTLHLDPLRGAAGGTFFGEGEGRVGVIGPSFVANGVTIEEGSQIGPLSVLGERSSIATGARVSESILWDNVTVGEGAVVEGAVVASRVRIGSGSVIEHGSVIGHDVRIPPRTVVPAGSRVGGGEYAPT